MQELTLSKSEKRKLKPRSGVTKEKTLEELYTVWTKEQYESMEDSLKSAFGENYEISTSNVNPSILAAFFALNKDTTIANQYTLNRLLDIGEGSGGVIGHMRTATLYTITIHFSKLVVQNGRREHTIEDLFIRLQISPAFNSSRINGGGSYFQGTRTSLSYAEISSGYGFSHLSGGWSPTRGFRDFCLGHTAFAIDCTDLMNSWNQTRFLAFCFQLEGYLTWESLEGGPYTSINDVRDRPLINNHNGDNVINSNDKLSYYVNYLNLDVDTPIEMISTPYFYTFKVKDCPEFEDMCTKSVTNNHHLAIIDPIRKTKSTQNVVDKQVQIARLKREYRDRVCLDYKGKPQYLVITDQMVEDDPSTFVAPDEIIEFIQVRLNKRFNETVAPI